METVAEITPGEILAVAISSLIPPVMAFLSLTLRDKANRWLNIIVGIVFIVLLPIGSGFELIPADYLPSIVAIAVVEVVALALIIWYAWKSKQKA
jgi:lipopolysaccharide export LptBFGC system permease protein LptF